mmetsp:Transcript_58463/g.71492  ORF Transcript_58463/g.71492 Transcript_58463/m.71492 type:complete len:106 (+) Transcript_58463:438-755(+)
MEPPATPFTSPQGMPGGTFTAPHCVLPTEGARANIIYCVLEFLAGRERLIGCCIAKGCAAIHVPPLNGSVTSAWAISASEGRACTDPERCPEGICTRGFPAESIG